MNIMSHLTGRAARLRSVVGILAVAGALAQPALAQPRADRAKPPAPHITVVREAGGVQVAARDGVIRQTDWRRPQQTIDQRSTLDVIWSPSATSSHLYTYRVDPDSATAQLQPGGGYVISAQADAQHPLTVRLVPPGSDQPQTVFSLDRKLAQWAKRADRQWKFRGTAGSLKVSWLNEEQFILTLLPARYPGALFGEPGKLLLVNAKTHTVRTLRDEGDLLAQLADGSLLIRSGWLNGEMQVLAPPFTAAQTVRSPGKLWSSDWMRSSSGRFVVWAEWTPLDGDWSTAQPNPLDGAYPRYAALLVWDQQTRQLKRFTDLPVSEFMGINVRWAGTSELLRFQGRGEHGSAQIELDPRTGQQTTLLTVAAGDEIAFIKAGPDGARYGVRYGYTSMNGAEIVRIAPDGQLQVLRDSAAPNARLFQGNPYQAWLVAADGRIVDRYDDGTVEVTDLITGAPVGRWRYPLAALIALSPDGRWLRDVRGPLMHLRRIG